MFFKRSKQTEEQEQFVLTVELDGTYTYRERFKSAREAFTWMRNTVGRENRNMSAFWLFDPSGSLVESMQFPR